MTSASFRGSALETTAWWTCSSRQRTRGPWRIWGSPSASTPGTSLSIEVLLLATFVFVAAVIFWRRSDDWMAMFVSLALVIFGTTLPQITAVLGEEQPALELVTDFLNVLNRDCPDQTDSSNHVTLWDGSNYKRAA